MQAQSSWNVTLTDFRPLCANRRGTFTPLPMDRPPSGSTGRSKDLFSASRRGPWAPESADTGLVTGYSIVSPEARAQFRDSTATAPSKVDEPLEPNDIHKFISLSGSAQWLEHLQRSSGGRYGAQPSAGRILLLNKNGVQEWTNTPKKGWLAVADRIVLSLEATKHARMLFFERKLYVRIVQARTGHAYTSEFRRRSPSAHPATAPVTTLLSNSAKTSSCTLPMVYLHSGLLWGVSSGIDLSEILVTLDGILTLEEFLMIERTNAFPPHPVDPSDATIFNQ
ncbi:hypothetical protein NMY22_g14930 [Coprinellus aureogranulatus]|nr:hypothetical protein NMY22_g14930 [Coprinellus aureogranulatus]